MKTTKELAKELGLLRKRTLSTSWSASHKSNPDQPFKYLIVIDFESTCWQDAKFKTQEIIEFPAVLLNTLTGEIESEFHHYVQPQEQPVLSKFCTELTGINQEQVDDGIPVDLCLKKFTHWIQRLVREKSVVCHGCASNLPVNTTCVTWSDWDLGVCLQYECKRKQLLKPAQLNSWIDLRATYRKFYDRKPNGLNGALQDLGITFEGREHSGVDDARNTAKLAYRMIKDGCVMKVTKTLKKHERSASCMPSIASYMTPAANDGAKQASNTHSNTKIPRKSPIAGSTSSIASYMTPALNDGAKQTANFHSTTKVPGKSFIAVSSGNTVQNTNRPTQRLNPPSSVKPQSHSTTDSSTPVKTAKICSPKQAFPTRVTPPRKAKQCQANPDQSKHLTPTKIPKPVSTTNQQPTKLNKILPDQQKDGLSASRKRKVFTPVKGASRVASPMRKQSRKVSPGKGKRLSVSDVYLDPPVADVVMQEGRTEAPQTINNGLKEHNVNIQVNQSKINTGTPVQKNSSEFKVPGPGVSAVKSSTNRRSFTTSTPMSSGTGTFNNNSRLVSPVLHAPGVGQNMSGSVSVFKTPAYNQSTWSSTSVKTPSSMCTSNSTKTPYSMCSSNSSTRSNSTFKTPASLCTPNSLCNANRSGMSETPPLCKCGRRCKRRMVQTPGPNMGRFFFSCSIKKGVASKDGCQFFKWVQLAGGDNSVNNTSSNGSRYVGKQFTPVVQTNSLYTGKANTAQKRNLGVRANTSQKVYLR